MSLRALAWTEILSAIGLTIFVPIAVEVFDMSSAYYVLLAIGWIVALVVAPILLRADRHAKDRADA